MKAAVLARGLATRMRQTEHGVNLGREQAEAAVAGLKAMMPIGAAATTATASDGTPEARPFLDYVLSALADAGCDEVGLVIGPEHHAVRLRYDRDAPPVRVRVSMIEQREPLGTADAVLACETWAGADPFIVLNGDNLYPVDAVRALAAIDSPGLLAFERDDLVRSSNIPAERVLAFALIQTDGNGWLTGIVEKPSPEMMAAAGDRALVSMNCWRFDRAIFGACRNVPRSARGEFELPQAVSLGIDRGLRLRAVPARGPVLDLSRQSDIAEVSRRLASIRPQP
jgi:dTDP-glucose pyrophosphorylase